ncbi:MAG: c-type cytochrome [Betaproteobacteria bacterium]
MCRSSSACLVALALAAGAAHAAEPAPAFGFGTPATPQQIKAWDIDVRPDGAGLPPGRGSVAQGQAIYDAKCASCHGTFGESTDYMVIAGGVGTLRSDTPVRTTGSKLNYATTLFDYIRRAMPFQAPKSLTDDEVYALTAYVLNLNDILPADAALDRASIVKVRMPNRDGFTTAHGMMRKDGKPDVVGTACMSECAGEIRLSSQMPGYARDSHGNLADQTRPLGAVEGVDTSHGPGTPAEAAATAHTSVTVATASGADLAKALACTVCHGVSNAVVGPAFRDVARKYAGDGGAEARLAAKVRQGGSGVWGTLAMPAQPQVKEGEARSIVQWILGGAK